MKLLIQSTGPHMYLDFTNGQEVNAFRPSVIERTNFTQNLLAAQKIELLSAELSDEATDAEFAKFWEESEGKKDLAIDSFLAKFSNKPELVKEEAPVTDKPKA